MLKLAINAQLPLIATRTRDTLNLGEIIKTICKREPTHWNPKEKVEKNKLYVHLHTKKLELDLMAIYRVMVEAESTLLVVNPDKIDEPMFDAGDVPVPKEMMLAFMKAVVGSDAKANELLRGLGGCTVKEAAELSRLTMARDNSLTTAGLMETRKASFQSARGLTQVDAKQSFYDPPKELAEWLKKEKPFFLTSTDQRLIPRGLMLAGGPGLGKTAASKWLAEQLGVPLYRMDIGGTKSKWVGASEEALLSNLQRLDAEAPAVVLMDEVEKVFTGSGGDTSGTTSTMLSQMLWWLSERRERILVIMTTNAVETIPPELYREGRIDRVMTFKGLEWEQGGAFAKQVLATYPKTKYDDKQIEAILNEAYKGAVGVGAGRASQAKITEAVKSYVKTTLTPASKTS